MRRREWRDVWPVLASGAVLVLVLLVLLARLIHLNSGACVPYEPCNVPSHWMTNG